MRWPPLALKLVLLVSLAFNLSRAIAEEPDAPLRPIEGVPQHYWFVYEGNWPIGDKQKADARNGLPFARISLQSSGDNHVPGGEITIILCRDGTASYKGDSNTGRPGNYTGSVDLVEYGRLCLLVDRLQFRRLAEDVRPDLGSGSHFTTAIVCVHRVGEKEPIENREFSGRGPIELFAIQSAIQSVADGIDWQKRDDSAAETRMAPKFTNGVLKALNGLSNLSELELSGQWDFDATAWKRVPNCGPKELSGLTHLQHLDLSEVNVDDEDLKYFSQWHELASLDLKLDLLSKGATFAALRSLPNLAALRVEWPPIEGVTLKELTALQHLVEFKGYVPLLHQADDGTFLARLRRLERLDLSSSTITDPLLIGLKGLKGLKSLRLCEAEFGEARLRELRALKSLTQLDLSQTRIDVEVMRDLGEVKSLRELDLSKNRLSEPDLQALADLARLEVLNIAKTRLTDLGLSHVASLRKLKRLDLFWNEITDSGIDEICKLKSLEFLRLARTQITDKALSRLASLEQLADLDLSGTDVTDRGLKFLESFPRLLRLSVSGPYISDAGLKELGKLTRLQHLALSGARITDDGLDHLKSLSRLERLDIDATRITDRGLKAIAGFAALQELNLDATRVTDAGMKEIARMKGLCRLTLSGTGITDAGMGELAHSNSLRQLRLAGCGITSKGFAALRGLKTLKALAIVRSSGSLADPTTCATGEMDN